MAKDRYLQALRGLAISAVVLIHCLPQCAASVAIRPFLNFSVALFLFLSGVLTDERKFNAGGGLRRRISKVAGPYAFWSVIYRLNRIAVARSLIEFDRVENVGVRVTP